ncbi:TPA: hypothetical protein ACU23B_001475 [Staphylococcus aureus]|uniref:hypothetical protein n=1 Tax=Staphylococcus aureus TaxID=1280 RepID=UPI001C1EFC2D|nr:hypothetical protein [Staphylococcus aureus]MBU6884657.1 hypothetical protein [Staphylococcus aureus]MBU6897902.1 hypothetical protein [Staphylococcus aureus]HCX2121790.1 hypothetical protein [Staphylococcus aureus]HCX3693068.1 hypothetical protein [Staphylococcus aureus]HDH4186159.1 hypothetical protein [Staphylococcus aureus]
MLEDIGDIRLLYQSIEELASVLGQSQFETKTVSLIFVQMDLRYSVFEKVQTDFMKYLAHKNSDEIKYIDLIKIIENALPEDKELSINVINSIIIGFANNYYPILQSLVPEIQSSYGITINKNFNIDSIDF